MGGNALRNTFTRRYQKEEFEELGHTISGYLTTLFPNSEFEILKSYRKKESFGDMDILMSSENLPHNYVDIIKKSFSPNEFIKNGNVLSFDFRELQVDLIIAKPEEYQTSLNYFAYNDLGNFLGRVAHTMGLKLGHDGLSYHWRKDTYNFRTEVIMTDWESILYLLGYYPARYLCGFNTLEDIFKFVISSPFFNKAIFQLDNRNNASRVRDKKRKNYNAFLAYMEDYEETELQKSYAKWHDDPDRKEKWLDYLFTMVPEFEKLNKQVEAEWERAKLLKERFNGDLVRSWTGLDGKELGAFMKWLKEENFIVDDFILNNDSSTIEYGAKKVFEYFLFLKERNETCLQ